MESNPSGRRIAPLKRSDSEKPTGMEKKDDTMSVLPLNFKDRAPLRRGSLPVSNRPQLEYTLIGEETFLFAVAQERKRSERSGKPFLLVLLASDAFSGWKGRSLEERVTSALVTSTRETDTAGWYQEQAAVGVMFTEIGEINNQSVQAILTRLTTSLSNELGPEELDSINISCHLYPEQSGTLDESQKLRVFYPEAPQRERFSRSEMAVKRSFDLICSTVAIILLSPVFLAIAVAIKLTSKGPILFRQTRVGQFGNKFTFLKFRSMHVNNDSKIHREYVTKFIVGKNAPRNKGANGGVYKITDDPRVTAVGRFLRRTSLDELPQFFNVLRGDMSLVGPRPPLPYEFECYDVWHRNRVFEVRPGITGLWQVEGRSKTNFDDMVRLDLKYARTWSIWLDLKILLKTPGAVLGGDGAY